MLPPPAPARPLLSLVLVGGLLSGCLPASIQRRGAVGLGADGAQGKAQARAAAIAAARQLGNGGSVVFAYETDGFDFDVTTTVDGLSPPEPVYDRYRGGWVAEARFTPRSPDVPGPPGEPLLARADVSGGDPAEALRSADARVLSALMQRAVARTPGEKAGRFEGRIVLLWREVTAVPGAVSVTAEALAAVDAPIPLSAERRCKLPLETALRLWNSATPEATSARLVRAQAACPARAAALADEARALFAARDGAEARKGARAALDAAASRDKDGSVTTPAQASPPVAVVTPSDAGGPPTSVAAAAPVPPGPPISAPAIVTTTTAAAPSAPPAGRAPVCREGTVLHPAGAFPYSLPDGRTVSVAVAAFCMDRTEASDMYRRVTPSTRAAKAVTYREASAACARAGGRLPTEAEWVYAARGAEGRDYPWGNAPPSCMLANSSDCGGAAQQVGALPPGATPLGVLDLGGNQREWTSDAWTPVPFDAADDAQGEPAAHVLRGGGWDGPAREASTLYRAGRGLTDFYRDAAVGFRCVFSPAP